MAETTDVRWPRDWEADRDPLTGDYWAFSPTILARDVKEVPVYVPLRPNGTPDLDGLLARLRLDPAEVEALRWLAKVVESSETWLKSKSGLQPKAILSALDKWRRVWDGAALAERGGDCG